jgi:outer membrane immunogenic protein
MRNILLGAASLAVIMTANSAMAADLGRRVAPVIAPAPAPIGYNWSGLYLGIHGGGAWGDTDASFTSGADNFADFSIDGPFVGAQIGYNFMITPSILLGIEADAAWARISGDTVTDIGLGDTLTSHTIDAFGSVRARLGYAAGPWLFYATGGWAWANVERRAFNSDFGIDVSDSATANGWTAGAGVEWALSQKLSLKAEYKYYDFGSSTFFTGPGQSSVDLTAHTATVGLNFKLF